MEDDLIARPDALSRVIDIRLSALRSASAAYAAAMRTAHEANYNALLAKEKMESLLGDLCVDLAQMSAAQK